MELPRKVKLTETQQLCMLAMLLEGISLEEIERTEALVGDGQRYLFDEKIDSAITALAKLGGLDDETSD